MNRKLLALTNPPSCVLAVALIGLPVTAPGPTAAEPLDPIVNQLREPPAQYTLRDVTMSLRRTGCLGSCPAYTLTIRGDGFCTLRGPDTSPWTSTYSIPSRDAIDILNDFYDSDFFVLRSAYTELRGIRVESDGQVRELKVSQTDTPHAFLTLTIGAYSKTIERDSDFGPKVLSEIADHMDRITDAKGRVERQRYRQK